MIFHCEKKQFLQELKGVKPSRSSLPILNMIQITAIKKTPVLISTNLEVGIVAPLTGCRITGAAATVVVDYAALEKAVRSVPAGIITIEVGDDLVIRHSQGELSLPIGSVEDYPSIAVPASRYPLELTAGQWLSLVDKTRHASTTDQTKPQLQGALLHVPEPQQLRMVTTDGRQLAMGRETITADLDSFWQKGIVLPRTLLSRLNHYLKTIPATAPVAIGIAPKRGSRPQQIVVTLAERILISRTQEEAFPDYSRVLVSETHGPEIRAIEAVAALKRILAAGQLAAVQFGKQTIAISTDDKAAFQVKEQIPVTRDGVTTEAITRYPSRQLLDAISAAGEQVRLVFTHDRAPLKISGEQFESLIMPYAA